MKSIGDKGNLCFVCGERIYGGLYSVSIWARNELLTPVDDMAYLPQFVSSLKKELLNLESGSIGPDYKYFCYGPTTDDVVGSIEVREDTAFLIFELSGSQVSVDIPLKELLSLYSKTIDFLVELRA